MCMRKQKRSVALVRQCPHPALNSEGLNLQYSFKETGFKSEKHFSGNRDAEVNEAMFRT